MVIGCEWEYETHSHDNGGETLEDSFLPSELSKFVRTN